MNDVSRVLVTYTTNAGSTKEVAGRIGDTIAASGKTVAVLPVDDVSTLSGYAAVVIGGPMILGWHRKARRFYRKHRRELGHIPHHIFMTAMKVTKFRDTGVTTVDPGIVTPSASRDRLSFKEKFTTVEHYCAPVRKKAGRPGPTSIAIFGGKLDYTKLKFPQMLFVMLVVGAAPGEKRNWDLIENWASNLEFKQEETSEQ